MITIDHTNECFDHNRSREYLLLRKDLDISSIRAFTARSSMPTASPAAAFGAGHQSGRRQPADQAAGGGARLPAVRAPGPQARPGAGGRAAARPGAPPAGAERRGGRRCARPRSRARSRLAGLYDIIAQRRAAHPAAASPGPAARARQPACEDANIVRGERCGKRGVDLALTTETDRGRHGEMLRTDRLVVGSACRVGSPSARSAAGVAGRTDLRVPAGRHRGAGGRLRRDWRAVCAGEQARAWSMPRSRRPGGGAAAALLGAAALEVFERQAAARGAPARAMPESSRITLRTARAWKRRLPRAISPSACPRELR